MRSDRIILICNKLHNSCACMFSCLKLSLTIKFGFVFPEGKFIGNGHFNKFLKMTEDQ